LGNNLNYFIKQEGSSPNLKIYAGSAYSSGNNNLAANTFGIIRLFFDGDNSKFQINNTTAVTGNWGTADSTGLNLGARTPSGQNKSNVCFKELILRNVSDNSTDETAIYNYLATKYGFTTI